jgi:hypothetical protein
MESTNHLQVLMQNYPNVMEKDLLKQMFVNDEQLIEINHLVIYNKHKSLIIIAN